MDEKEFDYMNVIPLVDVMLVLLTIVLTTSTFIATGNIAVSLPKASTGRQGVLKTQIITIDRNGAIYINATVVTPSRLNDTLQRLDRATSLIIRADRDIRLQSFVDVLDAVQGLGFRKVAIQTEKGGERGKLINSIIKNRAEVSSPKV